MSPRLTQWNGASISSPSANAASHWVMDSAAKRNVSASAGTAVTSNKASKVPPMTQRVTGGSALNMERQPACRPRRLGSISAALAVTSVTKTALEVERRRDDLVEADQHQCQNAALQQTLRHPLA